MEFNYSANQSNRYNLYEWHVCLYTDFSIIKYSRIEMISKMLAFSSELMWFSSLFEKVLTLAVTVKASKLTRFLDCLGSGAFLKSLLMVCPSYCNMTRCCVLFCHGPLVHFCMWAEQQAPCIRHLPVHVLGGLPHTEGTNKVSLCSQTQFWYQP